MATYEEIYGKRVKEFDSDPTLESSYEGQVWYDKSTGVLKSVVAFESTSSTSPMNTARVQGAGGGIQTDGFGAGGYTTTNVATTEEYNGTGFSAGGDLGSARRAMGGTGQTPAGLVFGGYTTTHVGLTEEYNGTSWSESGDLSTTRYALSSANSAPQTAALGFGGYAATKSNATEEYNGTSWTAGGNLNVATHDAAGAGTQTAGLLCGGSAPSVASNITELYDGSSWTSSGTLNLGRQLNMAFGTQTAAVTIGGNKTFSPDTTTDTIETFNGSTWSTSPATLATNRGQAFGIGAPTAGIVFGGKSPGPNLSIAEEYNNSINTITAAAWSSGGAYPTATADVGSAGTRTAGLIFAGETPAPAVTQATNEYNGSTFSSGGNTVVGRAFMTGLGTQTAAVGVGGAPSFIANSESYDGSSWSEGNDINTARGNAMAAGTQTAGLLFGGYNGSSLANTENYDGTSWTNNPNGLNTARRGSGGCGTQTAALCAAGYSTTFIDVVEEYNGTSWSEVTNVPLKRHAFRCVGTQTAALGSGGYLPGPQGGPGNLPTNSITYDGTSWSTNPSLATGNSRGGQAGTTTASFVTAGQLGSGTTTENFDAESTTVTAKTLTTS